MSASVTNLVFYSHHYTSHICAMTLFTYDPWLNRKLYFSQMNGSNYTRSVLERLASSIHGLGYFIHCHCCCTYTFDIRCLDRFKPGPKINTSARHHQPPPVSHRKETDYKILQCDRAKSAALISRHTAHGQRTHRFSTSPRTTWNSLINSYTRLIINICKHLHI